MRIRLPLISRTSAVNSKRQGELLIFAQGTRIIPQIAQRLRKIGGEAVQRQDPPGIYFFDQFYEIGKVGVVAERKRRVALVAKPAIRVDRPAGQDCRSDFAEIQEHG